MPMRKKDSSARIYVFTAQDFDMSDEATETHPSLAAAAESTPSSVAASIQPGPAAAAAAGPAFAAGEDGEVDIDLSKDITAALDTIGLADDAHVAPTSKVHPSPDLIAGCLCPLGNMSIRNDAHSVFRCAT
jgi:hypothetical protein